MRRKHNGRWMAGLIITVFLVLSGCGGGAGSNAQLPDQGQSAGANDGELSQPPASDDNGAGEGNSPQPDDSASNSGGQPDEPSQAPDEQGEVPAPDSGQADEGNAAPNEQDNSAAAQLQAVLAGMSLEEKIGQLLIAGVDGTAADGRAKRMVQEQHVGSIIFYKDNLKSAAGMTNYVNQLKQWNTGNKAPLMLSVDQEGGKVSRLPELTKLPNARQIGDTGKVELASEIGELLAEMCAAMGINTDYAPVLDINSNPDNPVIGVRSYGTTADRVSQMGTAVMKGMEEEGVLPVIKHFPGHGDTGVDSHLELPVVNKGLKQLQAFEWKPFEAAIEQGAPAVMVAHILFPKIDETYPASLSKTIITDQLRGVLGFDGVVMTDDLTMGAIADHYGIGEAAVLSVKAGTDMLLIAHEYANVDRVIKAVKQAVASGEITEARLDESVLRVLALKQTYEFDDHTIAKADVKPINQEIAQVLQEFGLK